MSKINVYAIGVFDMFHVGHLNHLKYAKNLDPNAYLIVGIISDKISQKVKKETIISEVQRKEIIQSLKCVDKTIIYSDLNQIDKLQELKIDIFAIGPEYSKNNEYYNLMMTFCKENNIRVEVVPRTEGICTTNIIKKCFDIKTRLENSAENFWKSHKQYPTYNVPIEERRGHEVNFILDYLKNCKSLLDLGCGDGSLVRILHEKTNIDKFYCYELSENLLQNLDIESERIVKKVYNINKCSDPLPNVDVLICAGVLPFIFSDNNFIERLTKTKLLLLRAPCTLKETEEIVDKFSTDLNYHYTALYRTVDNTKKLLEPYFRVDLIKRIYPDELESKYGTCQYYFVCFPK